MKKKFLKQTAKRYGKKEGEAIYYGTITNMAKKASKKNESIPSRSDAQGKKRKTDSQGNSIKKKDIIKDLNDIIKDLNPDLNREPEGIELDPEDYKEKYKKFKQQGKPYKITKVEEGKRIPT